jgi:hypothetical protein
MTHHQAVSGIAARQVDLGEVNDFGLHGLLVLDDDRPSALLPLPVVVLPTRYNIGRLILEYEHAGAGGGQKKR